MASQANPILSLLHTEKVSSILDAERKVYTLASNESVEDAVKLLSQHKIQSSPVTEGKSLKGMVDMLDILAYVVSCAPSDRELQEDELTRLEIAGRAIALVPLTRVIDYSGRDPLLPVFATSPLAQVTEVFAKGMHHAVVFSEEEAAENIVTGSDIVKFLKTHIQMGESKAVSSKSAKELGIGLVKPVRINKDKTVLEALRKMSEHKVSSLAVCNEGKLVGNFSASDLVGLYKEKFPAFLSSLEDFLKEYSPKSLEAKTTTQEATLLEIVTQLADQHLHHVWIVDDANEPVGIVSITDVCKAIHNFQYV